MVAVPSGSDTVLFNVHRVYGKLRYRFLTTNWQLVEDGRAGNNSGWQPVHVFRKMDNARPRFERQPQT